MQFKFIAKTSQEVSLFIFVAHEHFKSFKMERNQNSSDILVEFETDSTIEKIYNILKETLRRKPELEIYERVSLNIVNN